MEPFFRPAPPEGMPSAPCPDGCVAEPVGQWKGARAEVVFDPRRYAVAFVHTEPTAKVESALTEAGYERADADEHKSMWVLDRVAATRRRLAALEADPAPERSLT